MIVISRRAGDSFMTADGTKITVLVIANGQVRIGVSEKEESHERKGRQQYQGNTFEREPQRA
jgi:sRNA-binding carbon storage regulator CsrA